jgi:hypothetical protein
MTIPLDRRIIYCILETFAAIIFLAFRRSSIFLTLWGFASRSSRLLLGGLSCQSFARGGRMNVSVRCLAFVAPVSVSVKVVLVACLAGPLAASSMPLPKVAVLPIAEEALHGCDGHEVGVLLKQRLDKSRRFRLVADADAAALALEITNCTQREQRRTTGGERGGPILIPTGGRGMGYGTQREGGIAVQSDLRFVLEARVGSGSRSLQVSTDPKDRNLREGLDSLRKALDRVLEEKGDWLLRTSP